MKNLLSYIVQSLVDHPDAVQIEETENQGMTILSIRVNPQDIGKIIGKQGKIIKAIRNIVKIAAVKEDKKVNIEILEDAV